MKLVVKSVKKGVKGAKLTTDWAKKGFIARLLPASGGMRV